MKRSGGADVRPASDSYTIAEALAAGALPLIALEATLARAISEAVEASPGSDSGDAAKLLVILRTPETRRRLAEFGDHFAEAAASVDDAAHQYSLKSASEYLLDLVDRCETSSEKYDEKFPSDASKIMDSLVALTRLFCCFEETMRLPDHDLKPSALRQLVLAMIFQAVTIGALDAVGEIARHRRAALTAKGRETWAAAGRVVEIRKGHEAAARSLADRHPKWRINRIIEDLRTGAGAGAKDDKANRSLWRRALEQPLKEHRKRDPA